MNKALLNRDPSTPHNPEEREAILRELQRVMDSPFFCNSKRYPALLRYIVEHALAGRSDQLKERTLGIEVFDRPATYDTNADTVVRYTAGEVRKRLMLYYSERHESSGIRISLPAGSYVPEFLAEPVNGQAPSAASIDAPKAELGDNEVPDAGEALGGPAQGESESADAIALAKAEQHTQRLGFQWRIGMGVAALTIAAVLGFLAMHSRAKAPDSLVDDFWAPVLHNQRIVNVCTGGVVFQNNAFSGVITANKDNEYPFVSMQAASAISQVSALVDHSGASARLLAAPTTPVSDLREHPIILLGAYNNRWTMRLLQSARYQFTSEPVESILDQKQPQVHWQRDHSRPYSSADDYALIARFHDVTTGQWVIVLAGLGRNGTEAATYFSTNPHYMQLLQDQIGQSLANPKNIEAVLKVQVIDGKTGAPSIEAVQVW